MCRRHGSMCRYALSEDLELEVQCSGATDCWSNGAATCALQPPLQLIPSFWWPRAFSACSDCPETQQERQPWVVWCAHSMGVALPVMAVAIHTKVGWRKVGFWSGAHHRTDCPQYHQNHSSGLQDSHSTCGHLRLAQTIPQVRLALVSRPCHIGQRLMSRVTLQGPRAGMCRMECADWSPVVEVLKMG